MRLKTPPVEWTALTPTTVFREDIGNLLGVVSRVAADYSMETETHQGIKSVEELATLRPYGVRQLTISGKRDGADLIVVALGPTQARVWLADQSAELVGALELCKRILWRHPRAIDVPLVRVTTSIAMVTVGLALISLAGLDIRSPWVIGPGFVLLLLLLAFVLDAGRRNRRNYTRIVLAYGYESPGWWERNRDNVIVSAIFLVLGFVLGLVADNIIGLASGGPTASP